MAERLPVVGGDDGSWGTVLNNWLLKEHYDTNDGNTDASNGMHKGVTIRAGSTSVAPLSFSLSGADILTTPVAGSLEVNSSGVLFYTQSSGSGNRRKVMYYNNDSAGTGDLFYRDSSANMVRLAIGSTGDVLTVSSGLPSWAVPSGGNEYVDNVFRIKDNSDNTKKLAFEVSAISASTTRTLSVPDYDATIATQAGTETLSNKTLTTPKIADAGSINDGNGNEYLKFAQTTSAVNELTITNAATTTAPQLSATGGDTNIDLKLAGKGSGTVSPQSHISATSKNIYFTEYDNGNSGTSKTVDWAANGHKQKITMTGDCAFTFTAPAGPCNLLIKMIQDGTGSRVPSWPAAVKWPGGTKPAHSDANKTDIISFYYDGTNYYAAANLNFS